MSKFDELLRTLNIIWKQTFLMTFKIIKNKDSIWPSYPIDICFDQKGLLTVLPYTKQFSKFLSGFRIGRLHNAYLLQFRLLRSSRRRVLWTFFLFLARWKVISCAYKDLPCIKLKNFCCIKNSFKNYFLISIYF